MCRRCYESFSAVTEIDWESEQGGWSLCYHSWVGEGISQKQTQTVPVYHVDDSLGGQGGKGGGAGGGELFFALSSEKFHSFLLSALYTASQSVSQQVSGGGEGAEGEEQETDKSFFGATAKSAADSLCRREEGWITAQHSGIKPCEEIQ